jgi:hypothetical protein
MIPIHVATEDALSEAVLRAILRDSGRGYEVGSAYGQRGYGYLKKTIRGWNRAARSQPLLVLTDLDEFDCPAQLIQTWLAEAKHPNLLFRVAVREVESWLLADAKGFASFLRIPPRLVPSSPDLLRDAKKTLVDLARKARAPEKKSSLVPKSGSTARQGPEYNACLGAFVSQDWNIAAARINSPSLDRTVRRLAVFEPTWNSSRSS